MLNAILIDAKEHSLANLEKKLSIYCPEVSVQGRVKDIQKARNLIAQNQPNLVFIELHFMSNLIKDWLRELNQLNCESIIVSNLNEFAVEAIKHKAYGFLMKPIAIEDLILNVQNARYRIQQKEEYKKNKELLDRMLKRLPKDSLIGIPTMDGFDFLLVNEIIRCEGLQRCTRIVTKTKTNIVSSYNLGVFRKLLEPYGFFTVHKSYLINLSYVKKYKREGLIIMTDGDAVPISRRRKSEFLESMPHL